MRTRYRRTVLSSHSHAAATGLAFQRYHCSGVDGGPGTTNMSSASLDTHYIEEAMTDNTGRAASHPCYHKTMEVSIDTVQRQLVAPRADGPGGKVIYNGLGPVWVPSNAIWLGPLRGWDVTSRTPGAYAPRWSVPAGFVLNEDSLKNDVLERARGLKADTALNIIESSQIWPSIRSLATSLPEMAKNWKSIRKVIRTASGSYLAWKFGISPILDDVVSIVKYADRLKRDLKRYNEGRRQRVSRTANLPFKFDNTPSTDGVYNGITWGQRTFVGTVLQAPIVRYVLVVEPRAADECLRALDFVTSRFSSSPASLAWELVPFSLFWTGLLIFGERSVRLITLWGEPLTGLSVSQDRLATKCMR